MAWVEFKIEGLAWVPEPTDGAEGSDVFQERLKRAFPEFLDGDYSLGNVKEPKQACSCGLKEPKNLRPYNAGDRRMPDWQLACDGCDPDGETRNMT